MSLTANARPGTVLRVVGPRMGPTKRRGALILVVALLGALLTGSSAQAASSGIAQTIPAHFIASYKQRATRCSDLSAWPWVKWLSYANGTASDSWVIAASSKTLCNAARRTSDAIISKVASFDGASYNDLDDMINFARNHSKPSSRVAPRPAGPSWKCTILPSFWGESARTLGHGAVDNNSLAGASGAAAGAGFCEKGAARKNGTYVGGQFFSWAPDTLTCKLHYVLKSIPDPMNPGDTTNPPFPANLWDDYDRVSC